jgi:uncharacterized protein YcaQ
MPITLTRTDACNLLLAVQGLLVPPAAPATKPDVLAAIRRMGVLQIDTIQVVARSPYLVLFARLGEYDPAWLDEHLAEGRLFEHWSHAACFIPIEDYHIQRHFMLAGVHGWLDAPAWIEAHRELVDAILARIRAEGGLRSADFEAKKPVGGWWNWKDEKVALEVLLTTGQVMVARREKFQRVYDLPERVLPGWDGLPVPSAEEVRRELVLRSVEKLGAARPGWVADYYRLPKNGTPALLRELAAQGELIECAVEGWDGPVYVHPNNAALLAQAQNGELQPTYTTLLSPFDPLTWDRARARELFDFDYQIECYTPAAKRRYGYFSLPVLRRGALVARLDAKAHRREGRFEVRSLHFEPGVELDDELRADVTAAIQRCADWHRTPIVEYSAISF